MSQIDLAPLYKAPQAGGEALLSHKKITDQALKIVLPDWFSMDSVLNSSRPFALWTVGDQCLLYHWLDYALNQDYRKVIFYCSDRPALVRGVLERATLWPIDWELQAVSDVMAIHADAIADHLPEHINPTALPTDGWSLLNYWFLLQRQWLDTVVACAGKNNDYISIGRFCSIHPSTEICQPSWIGDHVSIGPGCKIGPYAVIGEGAILAGPSHVEQAVVAPRTFLSGHTELKQVYLLGGRLFNLRHQAEVPQIDPLMAGGVFTHHNPFKPPLGERCKAFFIWLRYAFKKPAGGMQTWVTHNGLKLHEYGKGTLPMRRRPWLMEVVKGRMRLLGVLPRTSEALGALSLDWQDIIREAPMGVFSYADINGSFSPEDDMEAVHAVYQATQPEEVMADIITSSFKTLFLRNLDERI